MKFSSENNSKILLVNSIASISIKIASILVALFTTPAYIKYFDNNDILGVWFTILSVLAWILNCDMGIGNGLRNSLVYAISKKDKYQIRKLISSAYIFLFSATGVLILILAVIGQFISWNVIFNISNSIIDKKIFDKAVIILIISVLLQFVLRLITSILYAVQKAYIPGLISLITNLAMLILVSFCNLSGNNNNIVQLAFFYLLAVNIPLIIATVIVFMHYFKDCYPSIKSFSINSAFSILSTGSKFLWLQLMALILDNTNSYLISQFVGNSKVVEYQVYFKIFSLPGTIVVLLSTSIWSIITKAKVEKKYEWLRKTYYIFMGFSFCISAIEFLIIPFLQSIFNIWLDNQTIIVDYRYALVFAISGSIMAYRTFLCTYSNGMCKLRIQIIWLTIGAILNIPLAYIFSSISRNILSVIWANIICMLPYCIIETINFCRGFSKDRCKLFLAD